MEYLRTSLQGLSHLNLYRIEDRDRVEKVHKHRGMLKGTLAGLFKNPSLGNFQTVLEPAFQLACYNPLS